MKARWLSDARKIPDEVMNYLRRIAVRAVEEKGHSPELIAEILGISRSSIYDWLRRYRAEGESALDTRAAPGAPRAITAGLRWWLRKTVLRSTPVDHGYDTVLWTRKILVALLERRFGVRVAESTVGLHLRALGLSPPATGLSGARAEPGASSRVSGGEISQNSTLGRAHGRGYRLRGRGRRRRAHPGRSHLGRARAYPDRGCRGSPGRLQAPLHGHRPR